MTVKLLNYHNFHSSKTDKNYSVAQVERSLTSNELNNGYVGTHISEEKFLPDSLVGFFQPSDIGKEFELEYEVVGNKANLINIVRKEK